MRGIIQRPVAQQHRVSNTAIPIATTTAAAGGDASNGLHFYVPVCLAFGQISRRYPREKERPRVPRIAEIHAFRFCTRGKNNFVGMSLYISGDKNVKSSSSYPFTHFQRMTNNKTYYAPGSGRNRKREREEGRIAFTSPNDISRHTGNINKSSAHKNCMKRGRFQNFTSDMRTFYIAAQMYF